MRPLRKRRVQVCQGAAGVRSRAPRAASPAHGEPFHAESQQLGRGPRRYGSRLVVLDIAKSAKIEYKLVTVEEADAAKGLSPPLRLSAAPYWEEGRRRSAGHHAGGTSRIRSVELRPFTMKIVYGADFMLTRTAGRYLSWPIDRLAALIAPTGVPPNVITWAALVFNLWAAIPLQPEDFAAAGGMVILAGLCDLLDGPVARLQGRVSLFGAFLDPFSTATPI